ncbi:unannotated protein [freshwater metagenome]|uniref:Unannotated protein n=1 Tax=freshwater metagenome TaxID=449393 RepID=A0A6J6S285_9ZZZZ
MREEEVVLVAVAVRRAAGLDLQDAGVAVQVGGVERLHGLGGAHERHRLRRRAGDHVAVDVEAEGAGALSDGAAVGVEGEGEVQAVARQQCGGLLVGGGQQVADESHLPVGALPLVAVDVAAEPDRRLVARSEGLVLRGGRRPVADLRAPRGLLPGLLPGLRCGERHEVEVASLHGLADHLGGDQVAVGHPGAQLGCEGVMGDHPAGVGRVVGVVGEDGQLGLEGVRRRHPQRCAERRAVGSGIARRRRSSPLGHPQLVARRGAQRDRLTQVDRGRGRREDQRLGGDARVEHGGAQGSGEREDREGESWTAYGGGAGHADILGDRGRAVRRCDRFDTGLRPQAVVDIAGRGG